MSEPVETPPNASPVLPEGRLSGRTVFVGLLRQAFAAAASEGWDRILLCDPDFADWPLGEREVIASLNAWASRGRTIHFLARDYRVLRQTHPRLVQWRTTWSHLVEALACASASVDELPSMFWSPAWTLQRLDPVRCTMVASRAAERRVTMQEQWQQWSLKATPAFPASTLGL
ncbi:hypothetical protein [Hydrogenophaga laconesensis]|uniref:Uncharacterized protein n=1 Tax=Hydrogenophaga laconesensis TaxID=1805971 RepID=A0ABU1V8W3_9BURK|nr:hypothetical protein [Hydrogenophaga laconesensis]MDR7093904.1 hypothetical protein [Hydrogenophaga laconesensis]